MKKFKLFLVLIIFIFLSGCAMVIHDANGNKHYRTLGIAHIKECTIYKERADHVIGVCTKVDTDAFSGWEAIMKGIGDMVVRIFTLGFK